jgi:uncharacterized protein
VAWARFCDRHSWLTLLGLALLSIGAGLGLSRFQIDPDISALLPEDSDEVELFKAIHLDEDESKTLYLIVRGDDLELALGDLVKSLKESPYLDHIAATRAEFGGSLASAASEAPLWFIPEETLAQLEERLTPAGLKAAAEESRELLESDPLMGTGVVRNDPLGLRWILGEVAQQSLLSRFESNSAYLLLDGGRVAFLRLQGHQPAFDVEFSEALLADVEMRCEGLDVLATGGYAIAREDSRRIRGDLVSSFRWSIPLLLIFFLITTRSLVIPHLYLIPTGIAIFWTLGYAGFLIGPMTPLAVSAAAILVGLGVDFSIHYVGRFREERARHEFTRALEITQGATGRSLLGCWMTSSVAFLSFALGSFSGLRDLGLLLALGLTLALFSTWTVLPLLLKVTPRPAPPAPPGPLLRFFSRLSRSNSARYASLTILVLASTGWLVVASKGVNVDADPRHLRPVESVVSRSLLSLEQTLGFSPEGVTLLMETDESPQLLVDAARSLLEDGTVTFADTTLLSARAPERAQKVESFRRSTEGWTDQGLQALSEQGLNAEALRAGVEQFATRFEANPSWTEGDDGLLHWQGGVLWRASLHPPIALTTRDARGEFRSALQAAVQAPTRAMDPGALGDAIGPQLEAELRGSILGCALIVALVIAASVGRLRAGWVAMTPVVCGLGVVLGLLAHLGWIIHPGNLLALPLLIGLGVDDGLYMVNRYLEGSSDPIQTTGVDVWRTSVATAVGFGSLITAESPAIASLGAIVLIGTATCFITTVVLIPWLLRPRSHA